MTHRERYLSTLDDRIVGAVWDLERGDRPAPLSAVALRLGYGDVPAISLRLRELARRGRLSREVWGYRVATGVAS